MYYLTTKQKSGLIFGSLVFLYTVFLFLFFFVILQFVLSYQLRHDLVKESSETLTEEIKAEKEKLVFTKKDKGKLLRNHLILEGFSAVLLDTQENAIRKFGVFESAVLSEERDDLKAIRELAKNSKEQNKFSEKTITWSGEQFTAIITPVRSNNKILGTLLIAKSKTNSQKILFTMASVFFVFSLATLIGSFALGYFLAERNLQPLKKISFAAEEIDLDKLDKNITILGSSKDEIVILAKKFNEMLARLKIMSEKQKDFISNASHELKTPLTRAISSLDILLSQENQNKDELTLIKSDLIGINDLLEKLLFLSKLKSITHIKKDQTNIYAVFRKVKQKLSTETSKKEINISENFAKELEIGIVKSYLEIVLTNLLSNAIKYSPTKSVIRVSAFKLLDQIIIEIIDQGLGMDEIELKHIFSRFYRGGEARAKEHGHGIGLAIVKEICDLYDILITINSAKNNGTQVKLSQSIHG